MLHKLLLQQRKSKFFTNENLTALFSDFPEFKKAQFYFQSKVFLGKMGKVGKMKIEKEKKQNKKKKNEKWKKWKNEKRTADFKVNFVLFFSCPDMRNVETVNFTFIESSRERRQILCSLKLNFSNSAINV